MPVTCMHMVAVLEHRSGLPEDRVNMTTNIRFPDEPSLLDRASAVDAYIEFFLTLFPTMSNEVSDFISDAITRDADACQILAYETTDLTGGTPFGSPTASANFTMLAAPAATELPEEVAAVISYHADLTGVPVSETNPAPPPTTIRPQARRRGRLFVGPLSGLGGAEVANVYRPTNSLQVNLGLAFAGYCGEVSSETTGEVAVWSRTDADLFPVVGGYVDNAWDTQRRRGPDASNRVTFSV